MGWCRRWCENIHGDQSLAGAMQIFLLNQLKHFSFWKRYQCLTENRCHWVSLGIPQGQMLTVLFSWLFMKLSKATSPEVATKNVLCPNKQESFDNRCFDPLQCRAVAVRSYQQLCFLQYIKWYVESWHHKMFLLALKYFDLKNRVVSHLCNLFKDFNETIENIK